MIIRYGKLLDQPYILKCWLRCDSHTSRARECQAIYYQEQSIVIQNILARHTTVIKIAHLDDDEDSIMGFVVYEPTVIHYVYTRDGVRRQGIARKLLSELKSSEILEFSHKPSFFGLTLPDTMIYNPYRAFR